MLWLKVFLVMGSAFIVGIALALYLTHAFLKEKANNILQNTVHLFESGLTIKETHHRLSQFELGTIKSKLQVGILKPELLSIKSMKRLVFYFFMLFLLGMSVLILLLLLFFHQSSLQTILSCLFL